MKNFKVCLHLEDKILKSVRHMVEHEFTLVQDPSDCDAFVTDIHTLKDQGPINILIVNSDSLQKFKGVQNLAGFHHYVIFNEFNFLEERVKKTLSRHFQISQFKKANGCTGVNALINLDEQILESGQKLPLIRTFRISNSNERKMLSEELEKFFLEIEAIGGFKNQTATQYAVEIQEELLMNAIWDANPKYLNLPRSLPIELDKSEEVILQWAYNGSEVAISVKDPFGRMDPNIMEKYINFIFKTGKIPQHNLDDQKISAGLGMYMVIQRANLLSVFVCHGKITDVGVVLILKSGKRSSTINSKAIDIIKV